MIEAQNPLNIQKIGYWSANLDDALLKRYNKDMEKRDLRGQGGTTFIHSMTGVDGSRYRRNRKFLRSPNSRTDKDSQTVPALQIAIIIGQH